MRESALLFVPTSLGTGTAVPVRAQRPETKAYGTGTGSTTGIDSTGTGTGTGTEVPTQYLLVLVGNNKQRDFFRSYSTESCVVFNGNVYIVLRAS